MARTPFHHPRDAEYEPLTAEDDDNRSDDDASTPIIANDDSDDDVPFSWVEYSIFGLLGMAMLWAWNMFMAAAPYFSTRLVADPGLQSSFQSSVLTVFTATNLAAMLVLSHRQKSASYPLRINVALGVNMCVFLFLTASTTISDDVDEAPSPSSYFAFLLCMVFCSAWATGLVQNGAFAFAASFRRPEYMQALMAGQAVAGILPPVTQFVSVLVFPPGVSGGDGDGDGGDDAVGAGTVDIQEDGSTSTAAFFYFLTAVAISAVTFAAFIPLTRRRSELEYEHGSRRGDAADASPSTPLVRLLSKLRWLAAALSLTFVETMFFPVFTAKITSVNYAGNSSTVFSPVAFVPLAFVVWNLGDLSGRLATMLPAFSLVGRRSDAPRILFACAVARALLIPVYLACNVGGRGALVPSDAFYMLFQLLFGFTNGWLGANCMMAAPAHVDDDEREAAGGFMGLCLVAGLAVGSLLSFGVSAL